MKQTVFKTVESFLKWFEEKTNRKVYIKVFSNGSGIIGDVEKDEELFKFDSPIQLSKTLDKLVERYKL